MSSWRPETKKKTIKIFVKLFKNTIKNHFYKKFLQIKILAKKSWFLKINDKKNMRISKNRSTYDFIDVLKINMTEKNI